MRDLLMHRVEQRKSAIRSEDRAFTIRVQTRPVPFAMDAGEDDLHIRIRGPATGVCHHERDSSSCRPRCP
ncbi:hypothetical protein ACFQ0G_00140 [Streptomyces chiangmaiensis]